MNGLAVPHQVAARSCSKVRCAAMSLTTSISACHAGDPYAGGGAGRYWPPSARSHVFQDPASGLTGVSTNPGGVGSQKPGPVGLVAGSHLAAEPSLLAR